MTDAIASMVPMLATVLLHFLWQGALVGVLAWMLLSALHTARPQARYAVACGALLACAMLPALTFAKLYFADSAATTAASLSMVATADIPADAADASVLSALSSPSNPMLPWIVALWAAGVQPSPLAKSLGAPLDRVGRVQVEPDLSVPGHPEIFAIGDMACALGEDGRPLPGLAPVAKQEGAHVARNILRSLRGEPREPFRYRDRGQMATIGRSRAIADLGRFTFDGFLAWLIWLVVHIYFLVGFKNRLFVVIQWAWSYLTYGRGARLIYSPDWRQHGELPG